MTNVGSVGEGKEDEAKAEFKEGDEDRPAKSRVLRWGNAAEVRKMMEVMETGHFDMVIGADLIYPEKVGEIGCFFVWGGGGFVPAFLFLAYVFPCVRASPNVIPLVSGEW